MSGVDAVAAYRQRILQETGFVTLPGMPQVTSPLQRLYIRIQALQRDEQFGNIGRDEAKIGSMLTDMVDTLNQFGEEFYRRGNVYRSGERPEPLDPPTALHQQHRIVILGASGSGKTTLLRYLAQRAAETANGVIPIFAPLKEYAFCVSDPQSLPLRNFALHRAAQGNAELFAALKSAERLLWLIDDLDVCCLFRQTMVHQINALPGDLVLTSRPGGYYPRGFETLAHFEILPMTPEETEHFLYDSMSAIATHVSADHDWIEARIAEMRPHLDHRVAHIPLLFSIFIALAHIRAIEAAFEHREELCDQFVKGFLEWQFTETPLIVEHVPDEHLRQIALKSLYYLGWLAQIHSYDMLAGQQLTPEHLTGALAHDLAQTWNIAGAKWEEIAAIVIAFWQQTGIIQKCRIQAREYLTFHYRLFQEYAAARQLAIMLSCNFHRTWKFLFPRVHHHAWREPLLMLANMVDEAQFDRLFHHLLHGKSSYERSLHRDLRLAAQLLSERGIFPPHFCQAIIQKLNRLNSNYSGIHQRSSYLTYGIGAILLLAGLMLSSASWEILLSVFVFWTIVCLGTYTTSIFPMLQKALSFPERFWAYIPTPKPLIHLFESCPTPEGIAYLVRALSAPESEIKKVAAEALGHLGKREATPHLLPLLTDEQESIHRTAALAIARIGDIEFLIQTLQDEHATIRDAAVEALVEIGKHRALPDLTPLLHSEKPYVRRVAIDILQQIGGNQAIPFLLEAISDPDKEIRLTAVEAFGHIEDTPDPASQALIISGLTCAIDDAELLVRWAAARALGRIHSAETIPVILQAIRKNANYVGRALTGAFQQIITPAQIPFLIETLNDPSPQIRQTAAEAIGRFRASEAIPGLIGLLQAPEASVRRTAAEALGAIGNAEVMDALFPLLNDDAWQVRQSAASALGHLRNSQAVPYLIEILIDGDWHVVRAVIAALGEIRDPEAIPYLIQSLKSKIDCIYEATKQALHQIGEAETAPYLLMALKSGQENVRKNAEDTLRQIGDAQAIPYLIQALQEPHDDVRKIAAETLGRIGQAEAVPHLLPLLEDANEVIRNVTAEALGAIGEKTSASSLIRLLHDSSAKVRVTVVKTLGRLGTPEAIAPLIELLNDQDMNMRRAAVESLGRLGTADAVTPLLEALHDAQWLVRWSATYALGRIGTDAVLPHLIRELKDENWNVRRAAAEALGQIASKQSVISLMKSLNDPEWSVRWAAANALGRIRDPLAVSDLLKMMEDPHEKLRVAAVAALGEIGDATVIPHLIQALEDTDWNVREAAAKSLQQMSDARAIPAFLEAMTQGSEYVRRTIALALRHIHDVHAIPYFVGALQESDETIRNIAAENLLKIGDVRAVPGLIRALGHRNITVRSTAADILGQFAQSFTPHDYPLLRRTAQALWWRLTDHKLVADAAFQALEQIANRLTILSVLRAETRYEDKKPDFLKNPDF